jgi:hypothetical protein
MDNNSVTIITTPINNSNGITQITSSTKYIDNMDTISSLSTRINLDENLDCRDVPVQRIPLLQTITFLKDCWVKFKENSDIWMNQYTIYLPNNQINNHVDTCICKLKYPYNIIYQDYILADMSCIIKEDGYTHATLFSLGKLNENVTADFIFI